MDSAKPCRLRTLREARFFCFHGRFFAPYPPHDLAMNPYALLLMMVLACSLGGCAVIAVADAAVTVAATGVKVAAKTVGAVADAVIPDGDD